MSVQSFLKAQIPQKHYHHLAGKFIFFHQHVRSCEYRRAVMLGDPGRTTFFIISSDWRWKPLVMLWSVVWEKVVLDYRKANFKEVDSKKLKFKNSKLYNSHITHILESIALHGFPPSPPTGLKVSGRCFNMLCSLPLFITVATSYNCIIP